MKRFVGITAIAVSVGLVVLLTALRSEPEENEVENATLQVNVQRIQPQAVQDIITGHGRVSPRWKTIISGEVDGRVLHVSEKFLSGAEFNKGDVLAEIDATTYVAALEEAKATLATAKRALKEEEQRAKVAEDSWKASGFDGLPSELVLRRPQLEEAGIAVSSARAAVKKAEYDLAQTKITVPYDGVVVSRSINPGDFVQVGMEIGRVYDRNLYEVVVPLSVTDIARLPKNGKPRRVALHAERGKGTWHGAISRIEQIIDTQNRWQNVVVEITDTKGLLPGVFMRAEFQGNQYDDVLIVPENMVSNDGYLWHVDDKETLQRFAPEILFQKDGMLFVQSPFNDASALNLTVGRDVFFPDVKVQANTAKNIPAAPEDEE